MIQNSLKKRGDILNKINALNNNYVVLNGVTYNKPKSIFGQNISVIENDKLYVNYREFKNGEWKITLMSIVKCFFA